MDNVSVLSDANFEAEVLQSTQPVLVDFWAPSCAPCRAIAPMIEALAAENEAIKFAKLDVGQNPQAATQYGVMSIPTLIFFKDGQEVDRIIGAKPKAVLQEKLDQLNG
jgi:thioredoxin 1